MSALGRHNVLVAVRILLWCCMLQSANAWLDTQYLLVPVLQVQSKLPPCCGVWLHGRELQTESLCVLARLLSYRFRQTTQ